MNKKQKWWLIPLMTCLLTLNAWTQSNTEILYPCPSIINNYPNVKDSISLVCCDNNHQVILTQHKDPEKGITKHTFIIKDFFLNIESYHTTYFNALDSTDYNVTINDMELYNGECYFCGTLTYPYEEIFAPGVLISYGIIGHFSPSSIQNISGHIMFKAIEEARSLSQLTTTQYQGVTALVCAVGIEKNRQQGCIVELYNTISTGWAYNLGTIANIPDLHFSDILAAYDSITLIAQFKCSNGITDQNHPNYDPKHQIFLIDRSGRTGFTQYWNSSATHYMAHFNLNTDDNFNFHHNLTPMRLYNTDFYNNRFGAAFGVRDNSTSMGAIRLFSFPHKMKYDRSIYYKMGATTTILDIGTWSEGSYNPFILSVDNNHTKSALSVPYWDDPNTTVPIRHSVDYTLQSISQFRSQHAVNITSRDESQSLNLIYQSIDSIHVTCLEKDTKHYAIRPAKQAAMIVADWDFPIYEKDIIFTEAVIIKQNPVTVKNTCKTCY